MRAFQWTLAAALLITAAGVTALAQPPGWPHSSMRPPGFPPHGGRHAPAGMHSPAGMHNPAALPAMPHHDVSHPAMHHASPPSFPEVRHPTPDVPHFGPMFEMVYTCNGCGKEIGRGTKPDVANCPHCGVRFNNTTSGMIANSQERTTSGGWNSNSSSGSSGGYNRVRLPIKLIGGAVGLLVLAVGGLIAVGKAAFGAMAPPKKRKKINRPSWDD